MVLALPSRELLNPCCIRPVSCVVPALLLYVFSYLTVTLVSTEQHVFRIFLQILPNTVRTIYVSCLRPRLPVAQVG